VVSPARHVVGFPPSRTPASRPQHRLPASAPPPGLSPALPAYPGNVFPAHAVTALISLRWVRSSVNVWFDSAK
jgi:hypothetical protein